MHDICAHTNPYVHGLSGSTGVRRIVHVCTQTDITCMEVAMEAHDGGTRCIDLAMQHTPIIAAPIATSIRTKNSMCLCVCICVRACVPCACVCICVCVCAHHRSLHRRSQHLYAALPLGHPVLSLCVCVCVCVCGCVSHYAHTLTFR